MSSSAAKTEASALRTHASAHDLCAVNLNYLIADEILPCTVLLYYQNRYVESFRGGEVLSIQNLFKIKNEFYASGFIFKKDCEKWAEWKKQRHPQEEPLSSIDHATKGPELKAVDSLKLSRMEFVQYAMNKIHHQSRTGSDEFTVNEARRVLQALSENRLLEWYFEKRGAPLDQGPIPDAVFFHNARVTQMILLFCMIQLPKLPRDQLECIAISALIHELEGDPANKKGACSSAETIELVQKNKWPIPEQVMKIIEKHDELLSGKGVPKKLTGNAIPLVNRIFSIVDQFEHIRLAHPGGTRRQRMEKVQKTLEQRSADFDPTLLKLFLTFTESLEVLE